MSNVKHRKSQVVQTQILQINSFPKIFFKCQNANMKIYRSLMICVIPTDAENLPPADITLRYMLCCYMMDELQLICGIPCIIWEIISFVFDFQNLMSWSSHTAQQILRLQAAERPPEVRGNSRYIL